jgi:hypothetical protein
MDLLSPINEWGRPVYFSTTILQVSIKVLRSILFRKDLVQVAPIQTDNSEQRRNRLLIGDYVHNMMNN